MNLLQFKKEAIEKGEIPLADLLQNSFFYPASGMDGQVVKFFSKETNSFVFCDYGVKEVNFLENMNNFHAYSLIGFQKIELEDLFQTTTFEKIRISEKMPGFSGEKYAYWCVYERNAEKTNEFGAERFSLLFISYDGVNSFYHLYSKRNINPLFLGIIQPGTGFGGNWTDFRNFDRELGRLIQENRKIMPTNIVYGGFNSNYTNFNWPNFKMINTIHPYYENKTGEVTIWKTIR
jgi:hypothetical protein